MHSDFKALGVAMFGLVALSDAALSAGISNQHSWALATPPNATVGAAFMTVVNTTGAIDLGLIGPKERIKTFTPVELRDFLQVQNEAFLLVDVREDSEWASGHIPGAVQAPLSRFNQAIAQLPPGKPLIFYCQSGNRSKRAFEQATAQGLPAEGHLGGGIAAWRGAGLPIAP